MSLIGDALKKAHLEAVRQDGTSQRLAHTPGVAQYRRVPHTGRKSWTTVLVVSNVILVLVVASAIGWALTREEGSAAEIVAPVATTDVATATTAPPPVQPVEKTPEPAAVPARTELAQAAPVNREPERQTPTPAVAEQPTAPAEPAESAIAERKPTASTVSDPHPSAPKARGGYVHGQTYMRSIPVPGGSELILNGMSIAGGKGVALINSRMVREGDRVGPFTVGSIADRRVALHYDDITIYLKLP